MFRRNSQSSARHAPRVRAVSNGGSHFSKRSGAFDSHASASQRITPSARPLRQEAVPSSVASHNILSRSMQQKVAREARPYLDEIDWVRIPHQPASYSDVKAGVYTLGNLTRMSEEQYAAAVEEYKLAVEYTQEVAKSINAELYYLGTSEAKALTSIQIATRLDEIAEGKSLVTKARATWGDNYTLVRIDTYWNNMREVYTIIGTGIYHSIGKKARVKAKLFERTDGHVYVSEEFGLSSEGVKAEIPQLNWRDPSSWLSSDPNGVLPQRLRVAVLQDDRDVISGLKEMKKRAGLREWEFDFHEADAKLFLEQGSRKKYDLILTDVLMQNGGGRYLARQLRSRGYEGSILTLSGFGEAHDGKIFFNDGIDGMIDLGWTPNYADRIWAGLNTYFILKKKHGWQH